VVGQNVTKNKRDVVAARAEEKARRAEGKPPARKP